MNPFTLVKMALQGFGVQIDPDELERTIRAAMDMVPTIAAKLAEIEASHQRTAAAVDRLEMLMNDFAGGPKLPLNVRLQSVNARGAALHNSVEKP